ncbi:MAG: hypothetical protein M0P31_16525 [Solirubrobacteraceae bacterium]|nr:hypothetical protein [Solirubrobacteraceae bacterium]
MATGLSEVGARQPHPGVPRGMLLHQREQITVATDALLARIDLAVRVDQAVPGALQVSERLQPAAAARRRPGRDDRGVIDAEPRCVPSGERSLEAGDLVAQVAPSQPLLVRVGRAEHGGTGVATGVAGRGFGEHGASGADDGFLRRPYHSVAPTPTVASAARHAAPADAVAPCPGHPTDRQPAGSSAMRSAAIQRASST